MPTTSCTLIDFRVSLIVIWRLRFEQIDEKVRVGVRKFVSIFCLFLFLFDSSIHLVLLFELLLDILEAPLDFAFYFLI